MTRNTRLKLIDAVTALFLLWFGSYAYLYSFEIGGVKPLYSYFLLYGTAFMYALYCSADHRSLIPAANRYVALLYVWLGAYLIYGGFEFLRSTQRPVVVQTLITLGEMVLFTAVFVALMAEYRRLRIASAIFAVLAIVGAAMNLWDFFIPTFSEDPGRAAGLYANPNLAGNFIAMAMAAGAARTPYRLRWPYVLFCGVGVVVSFSREAWIAWGIAVIWLAWDGQLSKARDFRLACIFAIVMAGGVTLGLFSGNIGNIVAETGLNSYLTPVTAARLGIGTATSLSGYTADLREQAVYVSLAAAARHPWLGYGLGYTREWRFPAGPQNMYLLFLVEGGVAGLFLYLLLMSLLWSAGVESGRALTLQIAVASFFSHNLLDQPGILLILAFIVAEGAVGRT
ncbi:MAG: O-antigen ligase family protein [Nitrococcus sp.]|nr:O-antigen ligase family protein [Nitrococcus sp.]